MLKVRRVTGVHASKANANTPSVELVLVPSRSRGVRIVEAKLDQVVHVPEAKVVLIRLKEVTRDPDAFLEALPAEVVTRVTLAQLRGKSLSGYRISVRDEGDRTLAEGVWGVAPA